MKFAQYKETAANNTEARDILARLETRPEFRGGGIVGGVRVRAFLDVSVIEDSGALPDGLSVVEISQSLTNAYGIEGAEFAAAQRMADEHNPQRKGDRPANRDVKFYRVKPDDSENAADFCFSPYCGRWIHGDYGTYNVITITLIPAAVECDHVEAKLRERIGDATMSIHTGRYSFTYAELIGSASLPLLGE